MARIGQEYPFPLKIAQYFFPDVAFAGWPRGHPMSTKASVEMYLCAFHLGKWEADESVEDAYHRALNITAAQFRRMQRDDLCRKNTPTLFIVCTKQLGQT